MAHADRALRGLAHGSEGLGQQIIDALALGQTRAEFHGLALEFVVSELSPCRFERIDARDLALQLPHHTLVATAKNAGQDSIQHQGIARNGGAAGPRKRQRILRRHPASDGGARREFKGEGVPRPGTH